MKPASPGGGEPTCVETRGVAGDASCPELAEKGHCRNCPAHAAIARAFFARPGAARALPDAPEEEEKEETGTLFLPFRSGTRAWALPVSSVEKVVPAADVKPLPGTLRAAHRAGLAAIDGEVVLVVRLSGEGEGKYEILAGTGEARVAIAADGIGEFVRAADLGPKPAGSPPYVVAALGDAAVPDVALLVAACAAGNARADAFRYD